MKNEVDWKMTSATDLLLQAFLETIEAYETVRST